MNIVCIVQARMGSTRLPGKVMKKICGKTVLEHDINRLKMVNSIDELIIATTENEEDNVIVNECKRLGITCFRGSETNVLSRYYYASLNSNADIIIRITSDCPLIDPKVTQKVIDFFLENIDKYDYVSNTIDRTFPRGLDTEIFTFNSLKKAFYEAKSERDKEHVTPYIWSNNEKFRVGQYIGKLDYSYLRWTLDTQEDFNLIEKIYKYFYVDKGNSFGMNDIIELYKLDDSLYNINSNIQQKNI